MALTAVQLKVLDNGIAVIVIDLPSSKHNLLSTQVMNELGEALEMLKSRSQVKGLIITSGKSGSFVTGADINEIKAVQDQTQFKAYEVSQLGKELFAKIDHLPFRVVAAINGICLGGGLELCLACDERLSADSVSQIGVPEVQLGLIPGWGGTVRLTRLVGIENTLKLVTGGEPVDARTAWKLGLVSEIVPADRLAERAQEIALGDEPRRCRVPAALLVRRWVLEGNPVGRAFLRYKAEKIVQKGTRGKFVAPQEALKVIFASAGAAKNVERAYEAESLSFATLAASRVSRNLVGIYFAKEHSKKVSSGATPALKIKKVGVCGAGVMGAGIAQAAAYAGYDVVLLDIMPDAVEKGMQTIGELFAGLVARRKLTYKQADERLNSIRNTTSYSGLADCDLIIEAIVEKMNVKLSALAELDKVVINKSCIFATNTSSLSVTGMSQAVNQPANVVGIHFFNPVHKMPLVEIVRGKETADSVVASALEFVGRLKKIHVVVCDFPGFVVNAILAPYLREAIVLAEEGLPLSDIERAMREFGMGFPGQMGPLELIDTVGLDIAGDVLRVLHAASGDRMSPPLLLSWVEEQNKLAAGRAQKASEESELIVADSEDPSKTSKVETGGALLGKKTLRGFYLWSKSGRRGSLNSEMISALTAAPKKKSVSEIQDRLVLLMINEAARCLEKGVIADAGQLDLAMIFGTGFPPYLGGPLRYADALGLKIVCQKLEWLSTVAGENYKPADLLVKKSDACEQFYD